MNREIKFRAWDTIAKSMIPHERIDTFGKAQGETGYDVITAGFTNIVPMQFTGLKDKNGKETWEGDLLLVQDTYTDRITDDGRGPQVPDNHILPVEFDGGEFGVYIKQKKDVLWPGWASFRGLIDEVGADGFEVIGNIYENPDLLKV